MGALAQQWFAVARLVFRAVSGLIAQSATAPIYLDISLAVGATWQYTLPVGHNAFAYTFEGHSTLGVDQDTRPLAAQELVAVAGGPGRGWRRVNTREELMQAFADFQQGRF